MWRYDDRIVEVNSNIPLPLLINKLSNIKGILAGPPPQSYVSPRNKGFSCRPKIKGNQWLINPDHKAGYFLGGSSFGGG